MVVVLEVVIALVVVAAGSLATLLVAYWLATREFRRQTR